MNKYLLLSCFLLILFLAGFGRLWQITTLPPGLYPDEAINGNDALYSLEQKQYQVFYPENNGREGLFIWLLALAFRFLPATPWSLRLVSAGLGILTIPFLYLLARELFQKKEIALWSSFFLAVSFWHINFSRIGFRAILVPLLTSMAFYFLWRAFRKQQLADYLLGGLFFGLGFYSYLAFRVVVLLLILFLVLKMLQYWREHKPTQLSWSWLWRYSYIKNHWWKTDLCLLLIILTALPLGLYFLNHPNHFISRASGISVFQTAHPLKETLTSTLKTLAMFHFQGDANWRHNLAGAPQLAWPVGLVFVIGLILVAKRSFGSWQNINHQFILGWFLIMLLPAVLTAEGLPHALRSIGVIPPVYLMAGLGLSWLSEKTKSRSRLLSKLILVFFLAAALVINFYQYFFAWAKNPNIQGAFRADLVQLAQSLNQQPENIQKVIIVNESGLAVPYPDGLPMPAQTIIFIEHDLCQQNPRSCFIYIKPDQIAELKLNQDQPVILAPLQEDAFLLEEIKQKQPGWKILRINSN